MGRRQKALRGMTRIIFLDLDGVLVFGREAARNKPNPGAVQNLNRVTDRTGAVIVISSSWRYMGLDKLQRLFQTWGIRGKVIGMTPIITDPCPRSKEIGDWVENGPTMGSYVIIDDECGDLKPYTSNLVCTTFENGFTITDADKAIAILEGYDP